MESLEVLVLTGFTLIIVFAAAPLVTQWLFVSQANLEYNNAQALLIAMADSIEGDFGMPGVQRYFELPKPFFGSFGVRQVDGRISLECGATTYSYNFSSLYAWYRSNYMMPKLRLLRGFSESPLVEVNDTLVVVFANRSKVFLYSRVSTVVGRRGLYIYFVNFSLIIKGNNILIYTIDKLDYEVIKNCPNPSIRVEIPALGLDARKDYNIVGDVYVVWTNATAYLK